MSDYLVADTELTSVANAIRTKSGGSSPLAFPTGFVSAINAIQTPLKPVAIRPDAEVWKTWSADRLFVADDGGTIPAYKTSITTLASAADIETITLSVDDYDYFLSYGSLTYPVYNTSTVGAGRQEYAFNLFTGEIIGEVQFSPITGSASGYLSAKQIYAPSVASYANICYWSSASAIVVKSAAYGLKANIGAVTYTTSDQSLKVGSPILQISGNATYLSQTYWNAMTDIRYQYVIKLWRVPKNSPNGIGWSSTQLAKQIADAVASPTHTLT